MLVSEADLAAALEMMSPHLTALNAAVEQSKEPLEGNILYMHQSLEPNPKNLAKQRNLYSLAASLPLEDSLIIEIGFNAGHSSLLMLSAHPSVQIIAFDLCEHSYTQPCFQVLAAAFPGRIQLIAGKSQQTLPRWARDSELRADLLHIDGDHDPQAARTDLQNAKQVARDGAWVVFDDTCFSPLKAVWAEALDTQLLQMSTVEFCPTNRHGIARFHRAAPKRDDLLWDVAPALTHRGRMRHVIVLAPTDHGQDSLLGYVSKHRLWRGHVTKQSKLVPNTTQRHQSEWLSLPLRHAADELPVLVQLVAPHFSDLQQISDCFPLVDGALIVVDCGEGLTEDFCRIFQAAMAQGIQPVLFMNKLDKLLSLEPDNELCYQRLSLIIERLNDIIASSSTNLAPLSVESGNWAIQILLLNSFDESLQMIPTSPNLLSTPVFYSSMIFCIDHLIHRMQVVFHSFCFLSTNDSPLLPAGSVLFGRGSLSVAESIGGWGFRLEELLSVFADRQAWTEEQAHHRLA